MATRMESMWNGLALTHTLMTPGRGGRSTWARNIEFYKYELQTEWTAAVSDP